MKLGAYKGLFLWFVFSCLPICQSQPIENNRNQTSNQKAEKDCLINVGWSEWKPYQYLGKDGRVAGYQINLLDLIGAKMGCQMVYRQQTDWQSSVESLKTQHIDLIGNASFTKNRLKYFYFSNTYREELLVLYVKAELLPSYKNRSLTELLTDGFKLGIVAGAEYNTADTGFLTNRRFDNNIIRVKDSISYISKMEKGIIDGFFEDPLVHENRVMNQTMPFELSIYPIEIRLGPIFFMFSKSTRNQNLIPKFNAALKKVNTEYPLMFEWFEQK